MALHGELGDLSLPDLFYIIQTRRLSGRLTLRYDHHAIMLFFQHNITLFFQRGTLICVTSSQAGHQLGQLALQAGKVTIQRLNQALAAQAAADDHPPLGEILVGQGWLTPNELNDLLIQQAEAILYEALACPRASFSFTSAATAPLRMPLHDLNVERIILEAARRTDEQATHTADATGLDSRIALIDDPAVARIVNTLKLQPRIVVASLRDGATTLQQVIGATGLGPTEVRQIVQKLASQGVLRIAAPSEMTAASRHKSPMYRRGGLLAPRRKAPGSASLADLPPVAEQLIGPPARRPPRAGSGGRPGQATQHAGQIPIAELVEEAVVGEVEVDRRHRDSAGGDGGQGDAGSAGPPSSSPPKADSTNRHNDVAVGKQPNIQALTPDCTI